MAVWSSSAIFALLVLLDPGIGLLGLLVMSSSTKQSLYSLDFVEIWVLGLMTLAVVGVVSTAAVILRGWIM